MLLVGLLFLVSLLIILFFGILDMLKGEFFLCMNFKVIVEFFVVIFRKVIKVLKCKFIFKMFLGVLSSFYKGLVRNFEIKFKVFVFLVYKFFLIFIF